MLVGRYRSGSSFSLLVFAMHLQLLEPLWDVDKSSKSLWNC